MANRERKRAIARRADKYRGKLPDKEPVAKTVSGDGFYAGAPVKLLPGWTVEDAGFFEPSGFSGFFAPSGFSGVSWSDPRSDPLGDVRSYLKWPGYNYNDDPELMMLEQRLAQRVLV